MALAIASGQAAVKVAVKASCQHLSSSATERNPSQLASMVNFGSVSPLAGCRTVHHSRAMRNCRALIVRNVSMQDSLPGIDDEGPVSEPRQYPPGLQRYESMVILRPDLSEEERVALIERYEENLVAGGALDVEMFNRGMQPLAYSIKAKNTGGQVNRYVDGIYLLFTYVTKPQSQVELQKKFNSDDDVIRSTTFRLKM